MNLKRLIYCSCTALLLACGSKKEETVDEVLIPSGLGGKELAELHCSRCHEYTPPQMLDKKTWEAGVLPEMGLRLGIGDLFGKLLGMSQEHMNQTIAANIYPDRPMLAEEDWKKIVAYYAENAPEKPLPQATKEKISKNLSGFRVISRNIPEGGLPKNTFVKFSPEEKSVYSGEKNGKLYRYDLKLKKADSLGAFGAVADIYFKKDGLRILDMGQIDPHEGKFGKFYQRSADGTQKILLDTLRRPVRAAFGDLDEDGVEDMLVCSFGFELGKLAWYSGKNKKENVLKNLPGARNVFIRDMNNDGKNDIVALMTQAREGVFIFYNQGNGRFDEKQVLSFSPVFGSSHIQLVDFNKDGFVDIVYSNGDNADFSYSFKSYHGLRIFENNGKNSFKEAFFYPVYGAAESHTADFDQDGDLDIALISYFPDKNQVPNEGFLFLENTGGYQFKVSSFPQAKNGIWMTMDVADMDKDGDLDIVLGAYERGSVNSSRQKLEMVILENLKR